LLKAELDGVEESGSFFLILVFIKEIAIGCIIGFIVATPFWAVQSAGYFIDNQRGSAIADSVAPQASDEATATGILFLQLYMLMFFAGGGFRTLIELIYQTYVIWPVYDFFPQIRFDLIKFIYELFSNVIYLAAILAGPIIFFMFMMEFSLALMTRFAPQVNVFVLALPLKCGVAFLVLVFYLPIIFYYWRENIDITVQLVEGLVRSALPP
ncbi:MAG: type III secretion system export apparatus subunit SctT, partial [Geminicoccaceae bacterium]